MNLVRRILSKLSQSIVLISSKLFHAKGHILMLHWIENEVIDGDKEPYRISVTQFKKLLTFLKKKNTINLCNWEKEKRYYALTIDDVPESFYYNAYPLLREFNIPFTIFVNISLLDKVGYIKKEQLIQLAKCDLCTIGSHGVNHCEYAYLSKEQVKYELKNSKAVLESIIGREVNLFAFPYGSYYACGFRYKYLALENYKYAFGTIACSITQPLLLNKYFLPRINVDDIYINSLK